MGIQCQPALQPEEGLLLRTRGLRHLLSLQPGLDSPRARTPQSLTSALVLPPICWSGCGYHPILWMRTLSSRAGNQRAKGDSLQAREPSPAQSLGGRAGLWLLRCVCQCPAPTITAACSVDHVSPKRAEEVSFIHAFSGNVTGCGRGLINECMGGSPPSALRGLCQAFLGRGPAARLSFPHSSGERRLLWCRGGCSLVPRVLVPISPPDASWRHRTVWPEG